ncbi:hypothetical protein SH2C18_15320 [Clostridium sediminicola]
MFHMLKSFLDKINKFGPIDISENVNESIIMTVEEYETILLILCK